MAHDKNAPAGPARAAPFLAVEVAVEAGAWPSVERLEAVAGSAVAAVFGELGLEAAPDSELNVIFSDDAHVQVLNAQWRAVDKPTNVLSFPAMPLPADGTLPPLLGDIVLARETVARESEGDGKPFDHHLAHLLVHGLLHLLGYDHEEDAQAEIMEDTERRVLAKLAIPDPYA